MRTTELPRCFVDRIHQIPISRNTSNRLVVAFIAAALEHGYTIRMGRHGLETIDSIARLWVAPELEVGNRSLNIFTKHAECKGTVSILDDNAEEDYRAIAGRFFRTYLSDSDELLN